MEGISMNERDSFKSRLGFLLVSAGCAIGIGNVWKFPYVTGEYGGAVFVLFYLLFLVLMGIPVMTMELAVGRASRKSAVKGYAALEKPGSKWHIHGWFCVLGCYLLMMYYTTVSGWMLAYFWKFVNGTFASAKADGVGEVFGAMLASPWEMGFFMAMTVVGGFLVCGLGLQSGVERITKVMMLCLLALIVVLAVHSAYLEGGGKEERSPELAHGHMAENLRKGDKNERRSLIRLHIIGKARRENDESCHDGDEGIKHRDAHRFSSQRKIIRHVAAEDLDRSDAERQREEGLIHRSGCHIADTGFCRTTCS